MTDRTHPDSGRIITSGDVIAELQDRIAELEAELEAVGAGGVSGPLMGRASLAASAGSEPVAWAVFAENGNIRIWSQKPLQHPALPLYAHPAPPAEQQATSSAVLKAIREANMQLVRTGDDAFMLVPYKVATTEAATPKAGVTTGAASVVTPYAVYAPMPRAAYIEFDGREETAWHTPDQMRDFADRTYALRMEQAAPKAAPREPVNGWPVEATIYKRRDEWVLELSGTINDCAFTCRHTQPGYLQPEDVAGLPSLYSEGIAPQQEAQEPVGQYLTVVYRDLTRNEAQALIDHEKMSAASWSHALHERDMAKAAPKPAPAPLSDDVVRDAAFEAVRKKLCALPRYSFVLDDDGLVRRVEGRTGNWIEFDEAHALFDPVAVDAAIAAQGGHK